MKKVYLGRMTSRLSMGLVGKPNIGKSTTFNCLSKQSAPAENYPFCTINPNIANVNVKDEKLITLGKLFKSRTVTHSQLMITDIAGLVKGASKGEGLGNKFLSHIQNVDGIYHVVRCFAHDIVKHDYGGVDPIRDIETINMELMIKDQ